ncbi:MAG: hypothetical protein FWF29_12875 [Treponema sp.]|nr:hypothetical protein [Treponema sp.]
MKILQNKFRFFLPVIFVVSMSGCDYLATIPPPYVITNPVFETAGRAYVFTYAGLSFDFLNNSSKTVNQITVSFMLFDAKTQSNPFMGSNVFEISRRDYILPNETREILISLDQYIYTAPSDPYLVDYFYISEITYTDGSVWQDKYGTYNTGTIK